MSKEFGVKGKIREIDREFNLGFAVVIMLLMALSLILLWSMFQGAPQAPRLPATTVPTSVESPHPGLFICLKIC